MLQEIEAVPIDSFARRESAASATPKKIVAQVASPACQSVGSASFVELRNTLPSHVDVISPFIDQLMRFISRFPVADESHFTIELALQEALANAIVHGNHEDPHKRVYVKCRCTTAGEVSITVQDEGHGFERDAAQDPTSPDNGPRIHLVGNLIRALMDEVEFEEGGSAVRMCKRGSTSSAASLPRVPHSAEGAL